MHSFRRKGIRQLMVLLATCLFLAAGTYRNCYAQDTRGPDGRELLLELNTDMVMFASPSTRLFLGWQYDANALFQVGMDRVSDHFDLHGSGKEFPRLVVLTLFTGASYVVNQAFSLTAHDEGHMEAARAIGASDVFLVRTNNYGQEMSIWEFFLDAFNFTSEPGLYTYTKEDATPGEQAYIVGEGIDTNML